MIEISVSGLTKSFEQEKKVVDHVSFQIHSGERVGLVGPNGAGKTTVFRMLTGEIEPDEGTIALSEGRRMGLISQIPVYPEEFTVLDVLQTAFQRVDAMAQELEALTQAMAQETSPALFTRYDFLSDAFERAGGYETDVALRKVASGLQIPEQMRTQLFQDLSGGEKTRVNLARLILEDTDVLLLDEPTNHLDLHATQWLEEYLRSFPGAVLAISHDRYFLDHVVSRVMELENGQLSFYSGNYSFYVKEKKQRLEEQRRRYEKEQAKISQLSATADRLHGWGIQSVKLQKRAFSIEKRMERMRKTERPKSNKTLKARFEEQVFCGDEVLLTYGLSMRFGEKILFQDLNVEVLGGERIAILGDNGTGKTTLLQTLLGEHAPTAGKYRFGPTVKIGYLPQVVHFTHPERNLVDTLIYEENCSTQEARDRLGAFLFQGEEVFKPVSAISGGEKSRLRLCMLMDDKINLLILDEPTNHLDLPSREWIENALEEYAGGMLFVSHDRYFVDKFATRVWRLENGTFTDFHGSYSEFQVAEERKTQVNQTEKEKRRKNAPRKEKKKSVEKQLAALEREIAAVEETIRTLNGAMEESSFDYQKLEEIFQEKEQTEHLLEELYQKWEILGEGTGA
ncbi:MAG: ribosomal protection-like ABC-F family protein [Oscillospiraceae bacterium]|jgi:ATP-binding cassette subfamily F protein 3